MNTTSVQAMVAMFAAAAGIEIYREFKAGHFPPRPFRFTGLAAVYAILAMLGHVSPLLANVLGLGMLAALIIKVPAQTPDPSSNASVAI
jgi:hypothetical protein